jgi:hypothetical protein
MKKEVTRFGSPKVPITQAGALLRALATKCGVKLLDCGRVDMAAAVLGADAWAAIVGASSLNNPKRYGKAAVSVLSASLARAAGYPGAGSEILDSNFADSPKSLRLADEHAAWAEIVCPDAAGLVLMRAGSDMLAGGIDTKFGAYGALLQIVALSIF